MSLICKIAGHKWKNGWCERCHQRHSVDAHVWVNGYCSVCGENLLREITGWSGADQATEILDAIRSAPTAESQNTLIYIALHLLEADSRAHRDIGREVAALVTDDTILLRSFSAWARLFEEEKCAEDWRTSCTSEPVSAAFTGVSERTRVEMDAIMKSHLMQIALNAGSRASVRRAIEGVGSFGPLSDEDARRFVPLTENPAHALAAIPMLMRCSPIWKTLLTRTSITALGSNLRGNPIEVDEAVRLLKDLYRRGCQRDAISKLNGTVLREAYDAPTDDDTYGMGSHGKEVFRVF